MQTPYDKERINPDNQRRYVMMYLKAKKHNPDLSKKEFCDIKNLVSSSLTKWLHNIKE